VVAVSLNTTIILDGNNTLLKEASTQLN